MAGNPLNIPPLSIAAVKGALIAQYDDRRLRRRASMLWGARGVGKSSIVHQVADHFGVPLVDLRLTTIEPVDIRGALYADERLSKTVWFPPEFLPSPHVPEGFLFLDELTAADPRLQASAYSLVLDRKVGNYRLPDGWQVIAAGNASFHGAHSHDMGTAMADRMFHFNVQTTIDAFLDHALARGFAPEVMAFLRIRPDRLDDTEAQLAADHLVGASPRGWEDVSDVLHSGLRDPMRRHFVQARIGAGNAAEFFGVLDELQSGVDVMRLIDARPGPETLALMPRSLDALYGMLYGLVGACATPGVLPRALEIVGQLTEARGVVPLPLREVQTLAMELLARRALESGDPSAMLGSAAWHAYSRARDAEAADA